MAIEYPLTLFLLLPAPWLGVVQAASETFRQCLNMVGHHGHMATGYHVKGHLGRQSAPRESRIDTPSRQVLAVFACPDDGDSAPIATRAVAIHTSLIVSDEIGPAVQRPRSRRREIHGLKPAAPSGS